MSQNPETVVEEFDYELPDEVVVEIDEASMMRNRRGPRVGARRLCRCRWIARCRPSAAARRPSSASACSRAPASFTLNGRTMDSYFPNKVHQQLIKEPLVTVEKGEIFDVIARLHGGGVTGQAGALRLAIARALIELDETDRPALKKAGFLTRDARATERKKYGLKKARKAPQYSKR